MIDEPDSISAQGSLVNNKTESIYLRPDFIRSILGDNVFEARTDMFDYLLEHLDQALVRGAIDVERVLRITVMHIYRGLNVRPMRLHRRRQRVDCLGFITDIRRWTTFFGFRTGIVLNWRFYIIIINDECLDPRLKNSLDRGQTGRGDRTYKSVAASIRFQNKLTILDNVVIAESVLLNDLDILIPIGLSREILLGLRLRRTRSDYTRRSC